MNWLVFFILCLKSIFQRFVVESTKYTKTIMKKAD
jgi:hypothetical protein